jgi:hypothetical protein
MKQPEPGEYEDGEGYARSYWQYKLGRVEAEIAEYASRKPFPRAKDSNAQRLRLGEAACYRKLVEQLDLPESDREPVASYDIRSRVNHWTKSRAPS